MNKAQICQLLPHSGSMCLLDNIIHWDQTTLVAQSLSQSKAQNPLRHNDCVHSIHGIEYAAQAMAIHSVLRQHPELTQNFEVNGQIAPEATKGYLASLKNIQIFADYLYTPLNNISEPLNIHVLMKLSDKQGFIYQFELSCQQHKIISGSSTIILL